MCTLLIQDSQSMPLSKLVFQSSLENFLDIFEEKSNKNIFYFKVQYVWNKHLLSMHFNPRKDLQAGKGTSKSAANDFRFRKILGAQIN